MSAPLAANVLHLPGKLVKDPTSLLSAYPHGGTELGMIRNMQWQPGIKYDKAISEEWKTAVAAFVEEERAVVACVLRTWDDDLLAQLFPNTQIDSYGQVGVLSRVQGVGVNRAGFDMAGRGFKLLFSPKAIDSQRCLLLYNAVPLLEEGMQLQLSIGREAGFALMFEAMPDSQGRLYAFDFRENIST